MVKYEVETKEKSKWVIKNECTDEKEVYKQLTHDLISKKLNNCTYIKSIKRVQLYNGFIKIYVNYDNQVRRIYTVEER
jgi:hypothetical protein